MKPSAAISNDDPFDATLWGEYARIAIFGTATCSGMAWAARIGSDPAATSMLVGNFLVIAAIVSRRFPAMTRLAIIGFAIAILFATVIGVETAESSGGPFPFFSPPVLIASLTLLGIREFAVLTRSWPLGWSPKSVAGLLLLLIGLAYMIVAPSVASILDQFRERPGSYTIEELTLLESLRIRSAKFAVFAIFTYVGACWGSFLNVVAYSIPRGESIALRSSACPKCSTPIRRVDNLPIFSYLNLGGRCRDCGVGIPFRYLVVELIAAGIFASLFLYELVTGAGNVPGFQHYHYAGILWIILYTKWPVVGIFFYHATLMCVLLTLALVDLDRRRCPYWFVGMLLIVFASFPIFVPTLQPFTLSMALPDMASRALTCVIGAVVGGGLGFAIQRIWKLGKRSRTILLAMTLLGISLGWQSTATIAVIFVALIFAAALKRFRRYCPRVLEPTAILLAATIVHHPFWKLIDGFIDSFVA